MGRKRHKHRQQVQHQMHRPQPLIPVYYSNEEETLIALVDALDLRLPHQLNNWRRFFLNHESYLAALKGWVEAQVQAKGHVRVIDDVDRGLMKPRAPDYGGTDRTELADTRPLNHSPANADSPWSGWEEWAEYQDGGYGYQGGAANEPYRGHKPYKGTRWSWKEASLPLVPLIPAPGGSSVSEGGAPHHIL